MPSWTLIAHGGAKNIAPQDEIRNREGLHEAIGIGSRILLKGGSALDAVEEVVKNLELNPTYNAGLHGCVKNEEGVVELDASIMDGKTLEIGAIAGIHSVEHPITIARALLREKAIFLCGEGAEKFAHRLKLSNSSNLSTPANNLSSCDTVGCVALDSQGNLAVATSTGGLEGSMAGRVGDVPLPGCGFYADNARGAASSSGEGEAIARVMLVSEFLHFLKDMNPDEAAMQALKLLNRVDGEAGLIAVSPKGQIGWSHNSPHFAVGIARDGSNPSVFLKKSEDI
jgi:beta-aspartyl-peptidase (threonine type)